MALSIDFPKPDFEFPRAFRFSRCSTSRGREKPLKN